MSNQISQVRAWNGLLKCTQYATWINTHQLYIPLTSLSEKCMSIHLQDSRKAQKNTHDYAICNEDTMAELIWSSRFYFCLKLEFSLRCYIQFVVYFISLLDYHDNGVKYLLVLRKYNLFWGLSSKASFLHPQSLNSWLVEGPESNSTWTMVVKSLKYELKNSTFFKL